MIEAKALDIIGLIETIKLYNNIYCSSLNLKKDNWQNWKNYLEQEEKKLYKLLEIENYEELLKKHYNMAGEY